MLYIIYKEVFVDKELTIQTDYPVLYLHRMWICVTDLFLDLYSEANAVIPRVIPLVVCGLPTQCLIIIRIICVHIKNKWNFNGLSNVRGANVIALVSASASVSACVREQKLNLVHNFLTTSDRAFILHMCIPCDKNFLTSWPWPWSLTYFWKTFNLGHNFLTTSDVYSLWQDLSHGTVMFDLMTLTLKFDLLLEKINLGYNFLTTSDRAFKLHMCIPCDKTFHMVP